MPSALADGVGEAGADEGGVARFGLSLDVPLGPEEREFGMAGGFHLGADFGDGEADAVVHGGVSGRRGDGQGFVGGEEIFDGVVGVAVAGDEVDGDMVKVGIGEEDVDPIGGGGWRGRRRAGVD